MVLIGSSVHSSDVMSRNDLSCWLGEECLTECDEVSSLKAGVHFHWGDRGKPVLLVSTFDIQSYIHYVTYRLQ